VQRPTQPLDTKLVKTNRPPGMNTIGMVAWKITMHTPQYPQGRKVIIIANDITHQVTCKRPAQTTLSPSQSVPASARAEWDLSFRIIRGMLRCRDCRSPLACCVCDVVLSRLLVRWLTLVHGLSDFVAG
jgi:hypothetical protein